MSYPPETPASTYPPEPSTTYPSAPPSSQYQAPPSSYPSQVSPPPPPPPGFESDPGSDSSTTDVAKEQASQVGDTAAQAGAQVAGVAKEQAVNVAEQTKTEARNLLSQTREELSSQAGNQQQRAAGGLRSLGSELQSMAAGNSDGDGPAAQVARQAADRMNTAAGWLENRDPGQVLTEVQRFARQRPGAFLALAAVAGLAAGRLTRGLTADSSADSSGTYSGAEGSTYQTGLGTEPGVYASPAQPDSAWPTPGTTPDPATAYGSGSGSPAQTSSAPAQPFDAPAQPFDAPAQSFDAPAQSFDAPAPPPATWPQEPNPPAGGSQYNDPGTGTVGR